MAISYLLFADDMLIFLEAISEQINVVCDCIEIFCKHLGQKVSMVKTRILFSSIMLAMTAQSITNSSCFPRTNNLGKYLGVPFLHKKASKETNSYIIKKIQARLLGWKVDHLSVVGRITLHKSNLSALPIYTIQSAHLPKSICNDVEKLCRRFIWGKTDTTRKVHLII